MYIVFYTVNCIRVFMICSTSYCLQDTLMKHGMCVCVCVCIRVCLLSLILSQVLGY
jgi:hypothetical protein